MSWDQTWRLKAKRLKAPDLQKVADAVAAEYAGVEVEVEAEADDCITFFFTAPTGKDKADGEAEADAEDKADGEDEEDYVTMEVSLYEMGDGTYILSLEGDASDNHAHWDSAGQLAEDLAEALGAAPLEL